MSQQSFIKKNLEVKYTTDRRGKRGQLGQRDPLGAFSNILVDQFSVFVFLEKRA